MLAGTQIRLRDVFRLPMLAVAAAYMLRMALLWFAQRHEAAMPGLRVLGLEEGRVAWSLATGKGFFGPFAGYDLPTAWLAPVYPFLWSLCVRASRLNSEALIVLSQTMNCAFSAATCWPVYSIGKKLFGEKMGLASAWAWVFLPLAVLMPLEWAWDQSLAALVLALTLDATLRLRTSDSQLAWTAYGLLWALAALVNPAIVALLPVSLGWLLWRRHDSLAKSFGLYARVATLFTLAVLPWTIRNYYAIDGWVFVKSNFGLELWLGNHPASVTRELHPLFSLPERFQLIMSGEPAYNRAKERMAVAYIESHPKEFAARIWSRFVDTWTAREDAWSDGWISALRFSRAFVWFCSALSLVCLAGMLLALGASRAECLLPALYLLIFPVPYYITHTALRYRHPVDPLVAIFAVYACTRLYDALKPHPTARTLETAAQLR